MKDYMDKNKLYILTFIITGVWDILLRLLSENYDRLPNYMKYDFVRYLIPYFKKHTLLSAALIAGFIGATTQVIIVNILKFPKDLKNMNMIINFLLLSFIISALYGFLMKGSKLFPHLEDTYYKDLGTFRSMYHDGISGLIVQLTILGLLSFNKNII
tara:strand:+ start:565 stop:1035 length:471 start_codon:yes stop_codon:yes gene_type:complete